MEEDRALADLGPEISDDLAAEDVVEEKKPKRRFIGRRAADAKAAAQLPQDGSPSIESSTALQAAPRRRTARALNNVPDDILHDEAINSAIALAQNSPAMAHAMSLATVAGRLAYLAGRMPLKTYGIASSPLTGTITS